MKFLNIYKYNICFSNINIYNKSTLNNKIFKYYNSFIKSLYYDFLIFKNLFINFDINIENILYEYFTKHY